MNPEEVMIKLSRLSERERKILQAFCEGLKYFQIAERLNLAEGTIRVYMYHISHKLELETYSKTERRRILLNIFCVALKSGQLPESPEPEEEPSELVLLTPEENEEIDDLQYEIIKIEPAEIVGPPPPPNGDNGKGRYIWAFLSGALLMAIIGAVILWAWYPFARERSEGSVLETSTAQIVEATSLVTVIHTQVVTEEVLTGISVTPQSPIQSPTETVTLTPTSTPKPEYYLEDKAVEIDTGLFLSLNSNFGNSNFSLCWAPKPGYNLVLNFTNKTSDQFLLRFDGNGFRVEDNLGREYDVKATGIGRCNSDPGLRTATLNPGNTVSIFVSFAGELDLDVEYLKITVDNISGFGPFVFRKDL